MSAEQPSPQNLAAEEDVLGSILSASGYGPEAGGATIEAVAEEGLRSEHFYRPSHGAIYAAALRVVERGEPPDPLMVGEELRRRGKLGEIGGMERLHVLAALVPATLNAPHHARLVIEDAVRRELADAGRALQAAAENGTLLDDDLREQVARVLEPRRAGTAAFVGVGHRDVLALDVPPTQELVGGIVEAGTVGTIAALPETFKSWLAVEIAHKVASGGGSVLGRKVVSQGAVGYWWQDDSERNEVRRIQSYAGSNEYADLPIRWHLNEGLSLPGDLTRLREEIVREGQVLVVLDSLYNFLPGVTLKDEEVASVYAAIKQEVCDPTGATVTVVDHAPWPTEGNRTQRRAYGSVFKAAAIRWGIYLVTEAETLYVEARGNNLTGLARTPITFDTERLELRVLEAPSQEVDLDARIEDFLRRNAGAATSVVVAGVKGNDALIARRLKDSERFVTVPPVLFGKPRNAICWARVEDAPSLLNATSAKNPADVEQTLARETDNNVRRATSHPEGVVAEADVELSSSAESQRTLADNAAEGGGEEEA